MKNKYCKQCNNPFKGDAKKLFCSKECNYNYYNILVKCLACKNEFRKKLSQIKKSENHFCSKSCAITYNNKLPKRKKSNYFCYHCKGDITNYKNASKRKLCDTCFNTRRFRKNTISRSTCTIGEAKQFYIDNNYPKFTYNTKIRGGARTKYIKNIITPECIVCGYNYHIDVCHIKPICEFKDHELVSTVNDVANLVGLCKNHHLEFDNKKININEFLIKRKYKN